LDFKTRQVELKAQENSILNEEEIEESGTAISTDATGVFKPDSETAKRLESESITFKDGPKFNEGKIEKELGNSDLVLLAAYTASLIKTMPQEEMRDELLKPYTLALAKER